MLLACLLAMQISSCRGSTNDRDGGKGVSDERKCNVAISSLLSAVALLYRDSPVCGWLLLGDGQRFDCWPYWCTVMMVGGRQAMDSDGRWLYGGPTLSLGSG